MSIPVIKNFDAHNVDLSSLESATIELDHYQRYANNKFYEQHIYANYLMITVIGPVGSYAGIAVDSEDNKYFYVAANYTVEIRVKVYKFIKIYNPTTSNLKVSVAFIRNT